MAFLEEGTVLSGSNIKECTVQVFGSSDFSKSVPDVDRVSQKKIGNMGSIHSFKRVPRSNDGVLVEYTFYSKDLQFKSEELEATVRQVLAATGKVSDENSASIFAKLTEKSIERIGKD